MTLTRSRLVEAVAVACHQQNKAWCDAHDDKSQVDWDEAPEWAKSSAIKGVEGAIGGNTPEQSHESWLEEKRDTGWVYGELKDAEAKTHPCMVAYSELPPEQRAKDALFVSMVRYLGQTVGLISNRTEPDT